LETPEGNDQSIKFTFEPSDPESIAAAFQVIAEQISKARQDGITFATALGIVIGMVERTSSARPISKLFIPISEEDGMIRSASPMAVAFGHGLKIGLTSPPNDGGSTIAELFPKAA
jgi:uncharacterized protein (UPF0210 family)